MKHATLICAVFAVGTLLPGPATSSEALPETIAIAAARTALLAGQHRVLDVRTAAEFSTGHIEGAINIDVLSDSFEAKVALLDKDASYVLHCAQNVPSGRTDKAIGIMRRLGFEHLLSLEGGIANWKAQGMPVAGPVD